MRFSTGVVLLLEVTTVTAWNLPGRRPNDRIVITSPRTTLFAARKSGYLDSLSSAQNSAPAVPQHQEVNEQNNYQPDYFSQSYKATYNAEPVAAPPTADVSGSQPVTNAANPFGAAYSAYTQQPQPEPASYVTNEEQTHMTNGIEPSYVEQTATENSQSADASNVADPFGSAYGAYTQQSEPAQSSDSTTDFEPPQVDQTVSSISDEAFESAYSAYMRQREQESAVSTAKPVTVPDKKEPEPPTEDKIKSDVNRPTTEDISPAEKLGNLAKFSLLAPIAALLTWGPVVNVEDAMKQVSPIRIDGTPTGSIKEQEVDTSGLNEVGTSTSVEELSGNIKEQDVDNLSEKDNVEAQITQATEKAVPITSSIDEEWNSGDNANDMLPASVEELSGSIKEQEVDTTASNEAGTSTSVEELTGSIQEEGADTTAPNEAETSASVEALIEDYRDEYGNDVDVASTAKLSIPPKKKLTNVKIYTASEEQDPWDEAILKEITPEVEELISGDSPATGSVEAQVKQATGKAAPTTSVDEEWNTGDDASAMLTAKSNDIKMKEPVSTRPKPMVSIDAEWNDDLDFEEEDTSIMASTEKKDMPMNVEQVNAVPQPTASTDDEWNSDSEASTMATAKNNDMSMKEGKYTGRPQPIATIDSEWNFEEEESELSIYEEQQNSVTEPAASNADEWNDNEESSTMLAAGSSQNSIEKERIADDDWGSDEVNTVQVPDMNYELTSSANDVVASTPTIEKQSAVVASIPTTEKQSAGTNPSSSYLDGLNDVDNFLTFDDLGLTFDDNDWTSDDLAS